MTSQLGFHYLFHLERRVRNIFAWYGWCLFSSLYSTDLCCSSNKHIPLQNSGWLRSNKEVLQLLAPACLDRRLSVGDFCAWVQLGSVFDVFFQPNLYQFEIIGDRVTRKKPGLKNESLGPSLRRNTTGCSQLKQYGTKAERR